MNDVPGRTPVDPRLRELTIDANEAARMLSVQGSQFAWLIGAGASAMSGIPTAGALTLQFKHALYCGLTGRSVDEVDVADRRVRASIEEFFDRQHGLPPKGEPGEYAAAFEAAYPSPDVRADLIAQLCRGREPNFGHYVLAALMAADKARVVFTTNFDDLIETAAYSMFELATISPRPSLVVADLGDPEKARRALTKESWPLVAKLHGDFRSHRLMNSEAELATQDAGMRTALRTALSRFGLVVTGYSGRDASVMEVLNEALESDGAFPSGVYWTYRSADPPLGSVLDFLSRGRESGRTVGLIAVDNFIEFAGALERAVQLPQHVREAVVAKRPPAAVAPVALPGRGSRSSYPLLRLNALPLTRLPESARALQAPSSCDLKTLQQAVRTARARALVAQRRGGQLIAVGHEGELAAVIEGHGARVTRDEVQFDWDDADLDPADRGLLHDLVTIGLGRTDGLRHVLARRGHQVRVLNGSRPGLEVLKKACKTLGGTVPGTTLSWSEAVGVSVEWRGGQSWLVFTPELWVSPGASGSSEQAAQERRRSQAVVAEFIRDRQATRYNREANAILDAWSHLLCGGPAQRLVHTWNLPPDSGIDPTFELAGSTAFSRPFEAVRAGVS